MFNKSGSLLILSLVIAQVFIACKKKNDAPGNGAYTAKATFTINGDAFSQQVVSIIGVKNAGINYCYYSSKDKVTTVGMDDAKDLNGSPKNNVELVFNGNKTGQQKAGDDTNGGTYPSVSFEVTVTDKTGAQHFYLFEDAAYTPGTITITKYGGAGDTVEGTFSGYLVDENGDPNIHITNGTFSITRNPDIN